MKKIELKEIPLDGSVEILNHPESNIDNEIIETEFLLTIKAVGVLEAPVITKNNGIVEGKSKESYVIVSGHRRIKAVKQLGLSSVYCLENQYTDKEQVKTDYHTFNIQRGGR